MYAFSPYPSTPPQVNPPPSPTFTLPLGFVHRGLLKDSENMVYIFKELHLFEGK